MAPVVSRDQKTRTPRQRTQPRSHGVRDRVRDLWLDWAVRAGAQQGRSGCRDRARGGGEGRPSAHLTALNRAYTSRLFPELGHSRNTSSGRQKATASAPHSWALSPLQPSPHVLWPRPYPAGRSGSRHHQGQARSRATWP